DGDALHHPRKRLRIDNLDRLDLSHSLVPLNITSPAQSAHTILCGTPMFGVESSFGIASPTTSVNSFNQLVDSSVYGTLGMDNLHISPPLIDDCAMTSSDDLHTLVYASPSTHVVSGDNPNEPA
ncbi:hypothetical protein LINPERPRIM_LOCUS2115, partial [Linum perenne]